MAHVGQEFALGPAGGGLPLQGLRQFLGLTLHLGDVDAQTDQPAVGGAPVLHHQPASVGELLLQPLARGVLQLGEAFGDPRLLPAGRFGVVAALDADPQGLGELAARGEEVGGAVVDLGVARVPEDVTPLGVQEDDALGKGVDGGLQAVPGLLGLALGPTQDAAADPPVEHAHDRPPHSLQSRARHPQTPTLSGAEVRLVMCCGIPSTGIKSHLALGLLVA